MARTIRVYTVLYDAPWRNDGISDEQAHFRREQDAKDFAATRKHYGEPCAVITGDVPKRIAERWGVA